MREKDWLVKVLEEASKRVENLPDWKKSIDLQSSRQSDDNQEPDESEQRYRCA